MIIIYFLLTTLLIASGCTRPPVDDYVYLDGIKIKLETPSKKEASFEGATVSGTLTSEDKRSIARLIARIPQIPHEIESLRVIVKPNGVEARVWVHGYEIDVSRYSLNQWRIIDISRYIE